MPDSPLIGTHMPALTALDLFADPDEDMAAAIGEMLVLLRRGGQHIVSPFNSAMPITPLGQPAGEQP